MRLGLALHVVVSILVATGFARPACANDLGSMLAAGGIVLVKTDAIVMQREDLTLSPGEVRVRYEMRNDTGKPVTVRVAFPLPDVPKDTPGGMETAEAHNIDMAPPTEPNFIGFRVWAAGKEIMPETDVRATLPDGKDVTAALREIGGWPLVMHPRVFSLPDPPAGQPGAAAPANGGWDLDAATRRKLQQLGALQQDPDAYDTLWTTRITFHWMQTFEPGVTVVEHVYRPILGVQLTASQSRSGKAVEIDVEHGRWGGSGDSEDHEAAFCIDRGTSAALRAVYKAHLRAKAAERKAQHEPGEPDAYITTFTLGYILQTARNWSGPIGTFHLTLKGGRVEIPNADGGEVRVMSLCTDLPLRQTAKLQFEATVRDYVPKNDLRVLLVTQ